jgi:hypothetical protein
MNRMAVVPESPSYYIEWTLRVRGTAGINSDRPKHGDPLVEANGRLAGFDWLTPGEAAGEILGMLDSGEDANAEIHGGNNVTLTPQDMDLVLTLRYVDPEPDSAQR